MRDSPLTKIGNLTKIGIRQLRTVSRVSTYIYMYGMYDVAALNPLRCRQVHFSTMSTFDFHTIHNTIIVCSAGIHGVLYRGEGEMST